MKKLLIILMVIAMASFLFVGCFPVAPPIDPDDPLEPDEPGVYLVGIEVDPEKMDLYVGETKDIDSVTATYEVRVYGADIALEDCLFLTSDSKVATVSSDGEVTAVKVGTANIVVSYEGKTDTLEVTVERSITITWFEDAIRYYPDGEISTHLVEGEPVKDVWFNDPLGPALLVEDDGGWRFADVNKAYNAAGWLIDFSGVVAISETGIFSGCTTYSYNELHTEDNFLGQVEIIVYEDGTSGTMVGTYTQWSYKFVYDAADLLILNEKYENAVQCVDDGDKWFIGHTDYITYPR